MVFEVATGQLASTPKRQGRAKPGAGIHRHRTGYLSLERSSRQGGMLTWLALPELKSLAETESQERYRSVVRDSAIESVPDRTRILLRIDASSSHAFHSRVLSKLLPVAARCMRAKHPLDAHPLYRSTEHTAASRRKSLDRAQMFVGNGSVLVNVEDMLSMLLVGMHRHTTAVITGQALLMWSGRRN